MDYAIRMNYTRSARKPIMATGITSTEVADIFIKALIADDEENGVKGIFYDIIPAEEAS